jgi:hypothetical protein
MTTPRVLLMAATVQIALLLTGCTQRKLTDASCNLEPKDLPKLLKAIRPLIEGGFGDPEIQTIEQLNSSTAVRDTRAKTFFISYRGNPTTLRVELKNDDVNEIEIWFITQTELAAEIQKQMKEVLP